MRLVQISTEANILTIHTNALNEIGIYIYKSKWSYTWLIFCQRNILWRSLQAVWTKSCELSANRMSRFAEVWMGLNWSLFLFISQWRRAMPMSQEIQLLHRILNSTSQALIWPMKISPTNTKMTQCKIFFVKTIDVLRMRLLPSQFCCCCYHYLLSYGPGQSWTEPNECPLNMHQTR